MEFLNIHNSWLRSPEFIGSNPVQRSTWLCLLNFCAEQENGGTIQACNTWADRKWQQLCSITKREATTACALWSWSGEDLTVWNYPAEKEKMVKRNREYGKLGGRPSGSSSVNRTVNPNKTTRFDSAETEGKGRELEGKEIGREDGGSAEPATGSTAENSPESAPESTARPHNLPEVIAYFASKGAPEAEAATFFDHYEANGWKQGGRAAIKSWRSAANNWVRRWQDGPMGNEKNSSVSRGARAVPPIPFNPETPNAHTGGLPDMGDDDESPLEAVGGRSRP